MLGELPNIYEWIEENPWHCSISNDILSYGFIRFLNESEGANCTLCQKEKDGEIPKMACAEIVMMDTGKGIACHESRLNDEHDTSIER